MSYKRLKLLLSIITLFLFGYISGSRNGGLDYAEYLIMFDFIIDQNSLIESLRVAKDPIIGFIVYIFSSYVESDFTIIFIVIAFLGVSGKYLTLYKIERFSLFFIFYVILLSPSLDFAAIRAMLALSFFGASLRFKSDNNKLLYILFSILSVLSHISLISGVILANDFIQKITYRYRYQLVFIVFLIGLKGKSILSSFSNTSTYINDTGTLFAVLPVVLFFITLVIYKKYFYRPLNNFNSVSFDVSFIISVVSLVLSPIVVVASFRFLQISQYVFLLSLCSTPVSLTTNKSNYILWLSILLLYSVPLIFRNIDLQLWVVMLGGVYG